MYSKDVKPQENSSLTGNKSVYTSSNPINSPIINDLNFMSRTAQNVTTNKMYGGYNNAHIKPIATFGYDEIIKSLVNVSYEKRSVNELFYGMHNIFSTQFSTVFTAIGLCNDDSSCINLKLIDSVGSTYSNKIYLKDETNPISKVFLTQQVNSQPDINFLKIPYLTNTPVVIVPISTPFRNVGVMLVGQANTNQNVDMYRMIANYLGMFIDYVDISDRLGQSGQNDILTGLFNHRKFQELLHAQLKKSEQAGEKTSVAIFDINNISQINKELGHAKGDEVIKTVAEKIAQNIRTNDMAARYGGDELAVIMPSTSTDEAKYISEYITYILSSCFIDGVGPIKVSVGIATCPDATTDQEKLLVFAEQAMYISKDKGYANGMSTIVSSNDFNFWDDMALSSFASVLTKRHSVLGLNYEEELMKKFHSEENLSQHHLVEVVTSLAAAIDAKDTYTKGHSSAVSRYAEALARAANLPEKEVERIKLGGMLHDIGKIGIPEHVLRKPAQLSTEEWEIMKQHPTIGAEKVLKPIESLQDLIPMVKYHHEHYDGTGYPEKLKGEEIPYSARIVAIADAYHALVSDRPYRKGLGMEKACEILKLGAGIQWDKDLVRTFIEIAPSLTTKVES